MNGDKTSDNVSDTTLRLSVKTRDQLAGLGGKDDRFEDILKRLIEEHYELIELKRKKQ